MNCVDCKNTGKQICTVCCTYQGGIPDRWEPKPKTNADRIRAMSDEELAGWLADHPVVSEYDENNPQHKAWLDWLRQEASNG